MPEWVFKKQVPGDTTRDPISGEFFATEAIRNSAEALVREGIQNSLDAGCDGQQVRVRLYIADAGRAARSPSVHEFFRGLGAHLGANGNGLSDPPRPDHDCRYLVFEDFGTRGLEGDPEQWHPVDQPGNSFFAFFRAEGKSEKESASRGRWGVGKFVFPRASEGSTFFGLTVRDSDARAMLMGRAILKAHAAGEHRFVPDGYFGERMRFGSSELVVPSEDPALLARFRQAFNLHRTSEPGLSLVIPWYDRAITQAQLIEAIVEDWFFSLESGELAVEVDGPDGLMRLEQSSLTDAVNRLDAESRRRLLPLLELAQFSRSVEGAMIHDLGLPDTTNSVKWHEQMLAAADLPELARRLEAGDALAFRVPVPVRPKGESTQLSHFHIYLRRDAEVGETRPLFVRDGIIVSDAKGRVIRGFRALVSIADGPLARLLGDAENPSHTEWRADTAHFKERYTYGPSYLTFVKNAVADLLRCIQAAEADEAPELLTDLFSLPREVPADLPKRPKPDGGRRTGTEVLPPVLPTPRPARYRVTQLIGGFRITRGDEGAQMPEELRVAVAYDVRRGNPFRKYDAADFVIGSGDIRLAEEPAGLEVIEQAGNRLRLRVTSPDFRLSLKGFDVNRDLIVRVTAKDSSDDHASD